MQSDQNALSQEDIDALFEAQPGAPTAADRMGMAERYDFRRSDRIPKEQIRALRGVHDTFARSLASSLSAYLRTYVNVNVISVEQMSFRDMMSCLPSPTCVSVLQVRPMDAIAILELNPGLAFPMIEMLLGGGKIKPLVVQRELTLIEQQILNTLLGLILQNLSMAWQGVATVQFAVDSHETEPGLIHVLPPNEAVVSIATEVQLNETSGMMNMCMPSRVVKLLRQKVDHQWAPRRANATPEEGDRTLAHVAEANVTVDARIEGSVVLLHDLVELSEGDLLQLEQKATEPVSLLINDKPKWSGQLMVAGGRKAITLTRPI